MVKMLHNDVLLLISSQLYIQWYDIGSLRMATGENVYAIEKDKHYKSRLSFSLKESATKHLQAQHWLR